MLCCFAIIKGLMVFFNDPVPCRDPAKRAVRMALGVREGMGELREKWQKRGHDFGYGDGDRPGLRHSWADRL